MSGHGWMETEGPDGWLFAPVSGARETLLGVSGRATAPPGTAAPTEFLARRLASALGAARLPIVRATQVHGRAAVVVRVAPAEGAAQDAGECDVLATRVAGVALVIQTADCVPILLRAPGAVAAAHAGWRGSSLGAASAAVAILRDLGAEPARVTAWIGPAIGRCCYQVGGEVASRFAGEFVRRDCAGGFRLDLKAVNRAQLESAGVLPARIVVHPACTRCGGDRYASYRRDGTDAGRMIGLIAMTA